MEPGAPPLDLASLALAVLGANGRERVRCRDRTRSREADAPQAFGAGAAMERRFTSLFSPHRCGSLFCTWSTK